MYKRFKRLMVMPFYENVNKNIDKILMLVDIFPTNLKNKIKKYIYIF